MSTVSHECNLRRRARAATGREGVDDVASRGGGLPGGSYSERLNVEKMKEVNLGGNSELEQGIKRSCGVNGKTYEHQQNVRAAAYVV